jgi:hypothetical protein
MVHRAPDRDPRLMLLYATTTASIRLRPRGAGGAQNYRRPEYARNLGLVTQSNVSDDDLGGKTLRGRFGDGEHAKRWHDERALHRLNDAAVAFAARAGEMLLASGAAESNRNRGRPPSASRSLRVLDTQNYGRGFARVAAPSGAGSPADLEFHAATPSRRPRFVATTIPPARNFTSITGKPSFGIIVRMYSPARSTFGESGPRDGFAVANCARRRIKAL